MTLYHRGYRPRDGWSEPLSPVIDQMIRELYHASDAPQRTLPPQAQQYQNTPVPSSAVIPDPNALDTTIIDIHALAIQSKKTDFSRDFEI